MPAQDPSCETLPTTLISAAIAAMIPAANVQHNPGLTVAVSDGQEYLTGADLDSIMKIGLIIMLLKFC